MYCTFCGSKNLNYAEYCGNCGKQLITPMETTQGSNAHKIAQQSVTSSENSSKQFPKNNKKIVWVFGIFVILLLIVFFVSRLYPKWGVSIQNLEYGYALIDGKKAYTNSLYPYAIQEDDPIIKNSKPEIKFVYSIPNMNDVILKNLMDSKNHPIDIKLIDNNKYSVQPLNNLPDGIYCLIVGNILQKTSDHGKWCFSIGNRSIASISNPQSVFEKDLLVELPNEFYGMYYVEESDKNITPEVIQQIKEDILVPYTAIDPSNFLLIHKTKPVFLLRSNSVHLGIFTLSNIISIPGISVNSNQMIDVVAEKCSAYQNGVSLNDSIEIVSGANGYPNYFWGQYGSKINLNIIRGTQKIPVTIERNCYGNMKNSIPFEYSLSDNGFVRLYPSSDLDTGIYCFWEWEEIDYQATPKEKINCFYVN